MGRKLGYHVGGIVRLNELIEAHRVEVEYELLRLGLRLRDCPSRGLNWRDVWIVVTHPVQGSPLERALDGDAWSPWTDTDYMVALIADCVQWLVWAKTKDGANNRNRPEPLPRPHQHTKPVKTDGEVVARRRGTRLSWDEAGSLQ